MPELDDILRAAQKNTDRLASELDNDNSDLSKKIDAVLTRYAIQCTWDLERMMQMQSWGFFKHARHYLHNLFGGKCSCFGQS